MPPRARTGAVSPGELIEVLLAGCRRTTLSERKEMVRKLLARALAQYREINTHTDRVHKLGSDVVNKLLERLNDNVIHWFAAHRTLLALHPRLSETQRQRVSTGQQLAYDRAFENAELLMVKTRYDVEQLVARTNQFPNEPSVPYDLYGNLWSED